MRTSDPETNVHSDSADTKVTETHPVSIAGIGTSQQIVNQPLTRRMKTDRAVRRPKETLRTREMADRTGQGCPLRSPEVPSLLLRAVPRPIASIGTPSDRVDGTASRALEEPSASMAASAT